MKKGLICHTPKGVVRFPLPQPEVWGMDTISVEPRTSVHGGVLLNRALKCAAWSCTCETVNDRARANLIHPLTDS